MVTMIIELVVPHKFFHQKYKVYIKKTLGDVGNNLKNSVLEFSQF